MGQSSAQKEVARQEVDLQNSPVKNQFIELLQALKPTEQQILFGPMSNPFNTTYAKLNEEKIPHQRKQQPCEYYAYYLGNSQNKEDRKPLQQNWVGAHCFLNNDETLDLFMTTNVKRPDRKMIFHYYGKWAYKKDNKLELKLENMAGDEESWIEVEHTLVVDDFQWGQESLTIPYHKNN